MKQLRNCVLIGFVFLFGITACVTTGKAVEEEEESQIAAAAWVTDFEDGTTMGWAGNNASADVATDIVHGGTYSIKVVSGDAGWKTVWFYNCGEKILADIPYSYSAWIYQNTGQDVKFNITIKTSLSSYKGAVYGATVPSGVWTEIKSDSFVLSSDVGTPQDIYIEPQTAGVIFYIDDIAILPK